MPLGGSAPRRYAEALLEIATEERAVPAFRRSLEQLATTFTPDVIRAVRDPRVPVEQRRRAVAAAVKDGPNGATRGGSGGAATASGGPRGSRGAGGPSCSTRGRVPWVSGSTSRRTPSRGSSSATTTRSRRGRGSAPPAGSSRGPPATSSSA